jgi:hypothetical protein
MVAVAILVVLHASSPKAQSGGYTYRLIFGPGGGGPAAGFPYDPPAINDAGLVVARPDCHILVFGNGTTSSAATAPLGCRGGGAIALNNAGVVAFDDAFISGPNQSADQILTTTGNDQFTTLVAHSLPSARRSMKTGRSRSTRSTSPACFSLMVVHWSALRRTGLSDRSA